MKPPVIAAVLNFILPGAGLLYLGKAGLAALNFVCAVALLLGWCALISHGTQTVHYVALGIGAGSAGFAHAVAQNGAGPSENADRDTQSASTAKSSTGA